MERGSIIKWLFIGLAIFLFMQVGLPLIQGKHGDEKQPLGSRDLIAAEPAPEGACVIEGQGLHFRAELSTRGASLRHVWLTDSKYTRDGQPIDLVTTSLQERSPLRIDLRTPTGANQQVAYDDFDWKLAKSDGKSCTFTYDDGQTALTKTVAANGKPFELDVSLKVTNLAPEARRHRVAVEQDSWYTKKDEADGPKTTSGMPSWVPKFGRASEYLTETIASSDSKTERQHPDDFAPSDFKKKEFTPEAWRRTPGEARFAGVSSSFFTKVVVPVEPPASADAETQIEEVWDNRLPPAAKTQDPAYGHVFRARLVYPEEELAPNASATYQFLSFTGPKERDLLGSVGPHGITDVIDLGRFSIIAKVLVSFLQWLYLKVGSWGWAICLMTIAVRTLLFPLSLSQIKSSMAMRKLKPEMDALNAKYKDDATQRGLALQELWRKNKVANPVMGCLPAVLQMPVWFALYQTLQTAVELYHTPFGIIPDLSSPFLAIPLVLGASSFVQQKLMPAQGDPQQQKMMMYMMPGIFTFMMLFLPAGLGVYMLTNTWLGITQQVLMERYYKARAASTSQIEVREKTVGDGGKPTPVLGKGKARVRG
jgi:YidC/Oxa1 family membrane protein insertase